MSLWAGAGPHEGVVAAAPLHAFLRAGNSVYDAIDQAEAVRASLRQAGTDPWSYPAAQAAALLAAWNAMVLQTLGESLAGGDRFTALPMLDAVTFEQAWRVFDQVGWWLSAAQRALADPSYTLDGVALPASLPTWVDGPAPRAHVRALAAAADAISARAEVAVAAFTASAPPAHSADVARVNGLVAQARSETEYAMAMNGPDVSDLVRREVRERLESVLGIWFAVGQLLAMPALIASYAAAPPAPPPEPASPPPPTPPVDRPSLARTLANFSEAAVINAHTRAQVERGRGLRAGPSLWEAVLASDDPLPAAPGEEFVPAAFTIWCLTEAGRQQALAADQQAVATLTQFWHCDPEPNATFALVQQLNVAVANGDLRPAVGPDGAALSLPTCPWPPVYDVVRPTAIGGQLLRVGTQVAVHVGVDANGIFRRQVATTS